MKRKLLLTTLALMFACKSINTFAWSNDVYRLDLEVCDSDRTFSIVLDGDEKGLNVISDNGIVTVNGGEACGICHTDSKWYISSDSDGNYNVVLDGTSINTGISDVNGTGYEVIECDSYEVFTSGIVEYKTTEITSEKFTVLDMHISGLNKGVTAEQLLKSLDINANATARVFTKNGIIRTGELISGDYLLCTDMSGNSQKYTFPEIDLGGIYSDFFGIDFETMTVTNVPKGLTDEQLRGAIDTDEEIDVKVNGSEMVITTNGNEYKFLSKIKPPKNSVIYYNDCENDDFLNWEISAANVETVYTDSTHKNVMQIGPELSSSNGVMKRKAEVSGEVFFVSNDIKYLFENPSEHSRQFNAPIIIGNDGGSIYVRERRGELVYRDMVNNKVDDRLLGIDSEHDVWHNIGMLVNPTEKQYSVYYDGEKKADGKTYSEFESSEYISYSTNQIGKYETGKMLVDNIAVFRPFVNVGVIEFFDGEKTAYNSEELSDIRSLKLIFSQADYNKINSETITKSISVSKNGETIEFSAEANENSVVVNFPNALHEGSYKITLTNPSTFYGTDNNVYEYSFNVGKRINHIDAQLRGNSIFAEIELSDNLLFNGKSVILAVYDENMKMCGVFMEKIENNTGNIFVQCDIKNCTPYYVKVMVWNDLNSIQPICEGYIRNL